MRKINDIKEKKILTIKNKYDEITQSRRHDTHTHTHSSEVVNLPGRVTLEINICTLHEQRNTIGFSFLTLCTFVRVTSHRMEAEQQFTKEKKAQN